MKTLGIAALLCVACLYIQLKLNVYLNFEHLKCQIVQSGYGISKLQVGKQNIFLLIGRQDK